MSRTEQDSDSDVEEFVPRYETTTVPDVFKSNEVRPPERAHVLARGRGKVEEPITLTTGLRATL